MCKDFDEVIFLGQNIPYTLTSVYVLRRRASNNTHAHITSPWMCTYTKQEQSRARHGTAHIQPRIRCWEMLMIWLPMKVLFTCLDLRVFVICITAAVYSILLTTRSCSLAFPLALILRSHVWIVWLEFNSFLHIVRVYLNALYTCVYEWYVRINLYIQCNANE